MNKNELLARVAALFDEYAEARIAEVLQDALGGLRKPVWVLGEARPRLVKRGMRYQLADAMKSGPQTTGDLRRACPGFAYRSLNGTIQIMRHQGLVVSSGRHGTKVYSLTAKGAEFFQ